jgi:hypothetical protein
MTAAVWFLGVVTGLAALVIIHFLFPVGIALVVAVSLLGPRPAGAAGVCIAWGAGFIVALKRATDGCAEFNKQPNAACSMGDNLPFLLVGLALLAAGVLLSAYAAMRARRVALTST